jgi:hypothetical protein
MPQVFPQENNTNANKLFGNAVIDTHLNESNGDSQRLVAMKKRF